MANYPASHPGRSRGRIRTGSAAPSPWIHPPWMPVPAPSRSGWRTAVFLLWFALILLVVVGSVLPASAPWMVALGSLHINDKVMHCLAYLGLSLLPMIASENWRPGIAAGGAMFALGIILEESQRLSPGRSADLGDAIANGLGVSSGLLLGMCIRPLVRRRLGVECPIAER